ncbi:MAG: glycosyltransferase [Alphaproteobacteria bacterium]|nr:glycosyltransferase [Alphaproteobacteria bacterium]
MTPVAHEILEENPADTLPAVPEVPARSAPVTIVMSNYNQAHYLDESLGGLVGQTLPAEKILVIDDGSTDNSVEIIRRYERAHPNLRLIRNGVNLGLQDSISRVLPLVTSDYLVWAASDDKLLPDFLERSMRELRRHPEAGLCFSELTVLVDETGDIQRFAMEPSVSHIFNLSDLPRHMPPEAVEARMKRSYFPVSGNTVVADRQKLAACGNFFKDLQWHSDHFAFNVLALRYGACVVPDTLGLIRQRSDSYSATGLHSPAELKRVLDAMLSILERDDFADVREAFRRAPSFYSVWGTTILRLMAGRWVFWPTAARYTAWKYKQFRLGYKLTHGQALSRLARRALRVRIPKGFDMDILGRKRRQLQTELESLKNERDGLISECDRLGQAVHETAQQRDSAHAEAGRLTVQVEKVAAELKETRREIRKMRRDLSYVETDLNRTRKKLEEADAERIELNERLGKSEQALKESSDALRQARETLGKQEDRLERVTADRDKTRAALSKQEKELAQAIQARDTALNTKTELQAVLTDVEVHSGPVPIGSFAPDTVPYGGDEARPPFTVPITTLPKSGTYYLARLFSEGLGVRPLIVSNQYFPHDTIYQPRLREFVRGGYVSQDHFPASQINVAHLGHLLEKIIVQLRDPRQATLSYIHFLGTDWFRSNEQETRFLIYPTLPGDFFERDLSGQLDWGIDHWLPELVRWLEDWVEADRTSTLQVKFALFEDLVADEEAYVREVLRFLDIPEDAFRRPAIELDGTVHFRKGETDEWRGVFNEAQAARANGWIPSALMDKFGWTP